MIISQSLGIRGGKEISDHWLRFTILLQTISSKIWFEIEDLDLNE